MSGKNAAELVDNAQHESVTEKRLTKLKGGLTARYLYDKPLIDHLKDDEEPHFILAARQNTPTFRGADKPSWSGEKLTGGMPMHLITDQRWLIVIGKKDGDELFEIPFSEISINDYSTSSTKHKISLSTHDLEIDIPIGNMYDSEDVEAAVEYLREFESDETTTSLEDTESNLIARAQDDSVTEQRLTELEGEVGNYLRDEPLIDYLGDKEQPHFIIVKNVPPEFYGSYSLNWSGGKGYRTIHMLTDKRWLIVFGHKNGDQHLEIPLDDITSIELIEGTVGFGVAFETAQGRVEVPSKVEMVDKDEIEPVIQIFNQLTGRESDSKGDDQGVEIIDRTRRGPDNPLYAKLIVPTKSSGAKITQKGWNIGGDIVRRTSSNGRVEEESWENYVKKLIVHDDHLGIGITHGDLSVTSDNQVHQTLRIDLNEINDLRYQRIEGLHGFTFQSEGDVYQFKLTNKGFASTASKQDAKDAVYSIKTAIKQAPEQEAKNPEESTVEGSEDDAIQKLSQIKELHDDGVLTDGEFEEKKQDLLDQV